MKLWQYEGKNVRVTLHNGHKYEGKVEEYTSALDNTPEVESICIGHYELLANEIAKIELI